jgi:hypothetical protein
MTRWTKRLRTTSDVDRGYGEIPPIFHVSGRILTILRVFTDRHAIDNISVSSFFGGGPSNCID